ncbi:hypothetical protein [Chengkuizengella sediminis]|uniref:hypothetical protein n=1 Tax=Chengkuizengella sediminis TaxID=1885917 RepID=UPI001F0DA913|nr:hypothetical protein [Chengkuizengella sediminis]
MKIKQMELFQEHIQKKDSLINMDRVKENLAYYGNDNADLFDLLVGILGSDASPQLCSKISNIGLRDLFDMQIEELIKVICIDESTAIKLYSVFGIAKKIQSLAPDKENNIIKSPEDVSKLIMEEIRYLKKEVFGCFY